MLRLHRGFHRSHQKCTRRLQPANLHMYAKLLGIKYSRRQPRRALTHSLGPKQEAAHGVRLYGIFLFFFAIFSWGGKSSKGRPGMRDKSPSTPVHSFLLFFPLFLLRPDCPHFQISRLPKKNWGAFTIVQCACTASNNRFQSY